MVLRGLATLILLAWPIYAILIYSFEGIGVQIRFTGQLVFPLLLTLGMGLPEVGSRFLLPARKGRAVPSS